MIKFLYIANIIILIVIILLSFFMSIYLFYINCYILGVLVDIIAVLSFLIIKFIRKIE